MRVPDYTKSFVEEMKGKGMSHEEAEAWYRRL
jgi:hypothetical protein